MYTYLLIPNLHFSRLLVEALAMTGSDLCASSKPWDLQMQTVTTIYEEFYMQGDSEMMAGRTPLPIMDRSFEDQQALHQVVCWFPPSFPFPLFPWLMVL